VDIISETPLSAIERLTLAYVAAQVYGENTIPAERDASLGIASAAVVGSRMAMVLQDQHIGLSNRYYTDPKIKTKSECTYASALVSCEGAGITFWQSEIEAVAYWQRHAFFHESLHVCRGAFLGTAAATSINARLGKQTDK
jgi:hypothetical protein